MAVVYCTQCTYEEEKKLIFPVSIFLVQKLSTNSLSGDNKLCVLCYMWVCVGVCVLCNVCECFSTASSAKRHLSVGSVKLQNSLRCTLTVLARQCVAGTAFIFGTKVYGTEGSTQSTGPLSFGCIFEKRNKSKNIFYASVSWGWLTVDNSDSDLSKLANILYSNLN